MGVTVDASIGKTNLLGKSVEIRVNIYVDIFVKDNPVGVGCIA